MSNEYSSVHSKTLYFSHTHTHQIQYFNIEEMTAEWERSTCISIETTIETVFGKKSTTNMITYGCIDCRKNVNEVRRSY